MVKRTSEEQRLAAQIHERQQLIRRIAKFSLQLIDKRGRVTHERMGNSNTHVVKEITIGPLRFVKDTGQSMMGGNDLYIELSGTRVFALSSDSFEFKKSAKEELYWNKNLEWFPELTKLMTAGSHRIIQKLDMEVATKKREAEQEAATTEKLNKLKTKAKSLAIEV